MTEPSSGTPSPLPAEPAEPLASEAGIDDEYEEAVAPPSATGTAARRRGAAAPVVQRAPTQSELAVRVTDNASRIFVIATVVIFAAILAFGLLAGTGGLLTTTPPPTAAPSVSAAPSASPS